MRRHQGVHSRDLRWPTEGGEMSQRLRAYDWATTPLGPLETWPQSLQVLVNLMLGARQPVYIAWGPALTSLYNDGYIPILGSKHPDALGRSYAEVWPEIWDEYRPIVAATLAGESQYFEDQPVPLVGRAGRPMSWFTFSWTPIRDDAGQVQGIYCAATETTERHVAEAVLRESEARLAAIFESLPVGIGVLDSDGKLILANHEMRRYLPTGIMPSRDQSRHERWRAYYPDGRRVERQDFPGASALRGERVVPGMEMLYTQDDGTEMWTSVAAVPILDIVGRVTGAVVVVTDIDAGKRTDAALRAIEARLARERAQLLVAEAVSRERQALLQRIVRAQEEERAKVSREIHDTITQLAHAAAMYLDSAVDLLPAQPEQAQPTVQRGRDLARQAANEARRLIAGLRPEALDDLGLAGAIQQEVAALRAVGWPVELIDGDLVGVRLDPEVEISLYRVAQEALSNVRRHAGKGRVRVTLKLLNGNVRLEVRDWGRGFDPRAVKPSPKGDHVGLTSMRERLALLGGTLEVRSSTERGTTVRATVPCRKRT